MRAVTQSSSSRPGGLPSMRVESGITVADLLAEPRLHAILRLVAGEEGRDRPVDHPRVQKPGLALAGHTHGVVPTRVQILGETELTFLEGLSPEERRVRAAVLFDLGLSLVVLTRGVTPPACAARGCSGYRDAVGGRRTAIQSRDPSDSPSPRQRSCAVRDSAWRPDGRARRGDPAPRAERHW